MCGISSKHSVHQRDGRPCVLILGGYGVFGGRLARRLLTAQDVDVIVGGRNPDRGDAFVSRWGGRSVAIDRDDTVALAGLLSTLRPNVLIDAAGPFQAYGANPYRIPRLAAEAGSHYLDLSDDRDFVVGFAGLDALARARQVAMVSGASTIPSISGAVTDRLTDGLTRCDVIETVILPGNRAPRGLSVVKAILAQTGQPIRVREDGVWRSRRGWSQGKSYRLCIDGVAPLGRRTASIIGAPDLDLFPSRYDAATVVFRAGLELRLMHLGLAVLASPVRAGVLPSLTFFARPLLFLATLLERWGSDRGGMQVAVQGCRADGLAVRRTWTLIAEAGDGPWIPVAPAGILARRMLAGEMAPGAGSALGLLTLAELTAALRDFAISTEIVETTLPAGAR